MKEENLIFIISQPRSGSTFLQNLLSNNNFVNTASEHWALLNFAQILKPEILYAGFDVRLANIGFQDYLNKNKDFDFNVKFKKFLLGLYEPLQNGFEYVIDKTPRYWEIMDELVRLFPMSRIIILRRNPSDVAKSIIKTWRLESLSEINSYRRDLLKAPFKIEQFCKEHEDNENVLSLDYEILIHNIDREVEKIMIWLGLDYNSDMLNLELNNKTKGIFGDPYQNTLHQGDITKEKSKQFKFNAMHFEFLEGYHEYIKSNINKSENEISKGEYKKNMVFTEFLQMDEYFITDPGELTTIRKLEDKIEKLNKSIHLLKNSNQYKMGQIFISPIRFLKKLIKS